MKPDIEPRGDGYVAAWQPIGVGMTFDRVRESDTGQLYVELTIESARAEDPGLLHWSRVSLSSGAERERLTKILTKAAPDVDWGPTLNRTFQEIAVLHRTPPAPVSLADVPLLAQPPLAWEPIMPLGETTITMADGGSGKSYRALLTAACVAAGVPMPFGGPLALRGPALYLDYESHESGQRRRLERVCAGLRLPRLPRELYYLQLRGRGALVDHVRDLRAMVQKVGAVYVVIDSLGWACGSDLTRTEVAIPTMDAIASLGAGVTKDVLAHYAKENREVGRRASVYGNAFFEFAARAVWELRREQFGRDEYACALLPRKVNDGSPDQEGVGYRIRFGPGGGPVSFTPADVRDSEELSEHLPLSIRLRAILAGGAPYTKRELADKTGEKEESVRKALYRMADVALIGGRGLDSAYRLAERRHGTDGIGPERANGTVPFEAEHDDEIDLPF